MVADHRRKRLNSASIAGCSSWEQYRTKKKKLELPKKDSNAKSLISLEWDGNQRKVVAKRAQVGINQRDFRPYIDSIPQNNDILADVLAIPQEVFELGNLAEVLSYEVWQTHLSENERNYLMKFLPSGQATEKVVQALLSGDNLNFGNPFLKWGASLCLGNLHPDAVLHQEQFLKAEKKAYYSEIQKYHNEMIKYLQKLKDMWQSSKDPEKEVLQNMWRSTGDAGKRTPHATESRLQELGGNAVATSESSSLVADEKACSSDNQNSPAMKDGEMKKRIFEKGSMEEKCKKLLITSEDARPRKGVKLQKRNIHHSDGAKYMSYLKISKKQHELVKNMKQSGKSIQSKSLNCVLGDLDTLHVQPYEEFVKEEQKKLQAHWWRLANKDLPAAYSNWRESEFQRWEMTRLLDQDMKNKLKSLMEDHEYKKHETLLEEIENHETVFEEIENHETLLEEIENHETLPEEIENHDAVLQEIENHDTVLQEIENHDTVLQEIEKHQTVLLDENDEEKSKKESDVEEENKTHETVLQDQNDQRARNQEMNVADNADSDSGSPQNLSPQQISSLGGGCDLNPIDMNSENNHVVSHDASPHVSEDLGNADTAVASIGQGVPISAGGDVWSAVAMRNSYYDSTANHEYTSTSGLSLPHQINDEQRTQLIDLESDVSETGNRKDLLHRQSDDGSFCSYPNHDRSGLLQSLLKGQGMSSYHHEQRQTRLDFQSPNSVMMEDSQFPRNLQGHLLTSLPLALGPKRHTADYMQQNISEGVYCAGGGYMIPRQGHVQPVNLQDWNLNPVRMSARLQSHSNDDGVLTQNWFSGEHQVCGGWTGSGTASVPSQSIGSNVDQSLYSVLSQCNQLHSNSPFDSMASTDQFMLPRNYGVAHRISNTLPQATHPLDYLSGRDTASSLMQDDMGWMNLPQNSALHDPMGKPYLRSWNQ